MPCGLVAADCNLKAFDEKELFLDAAYTRGGFSGVEYALNEQKRFALEAQKVGLLTPELTELRQMQQQNKLGTARALFEAELDCVAGNGTTYAPIAVRYDVVDGAFYSSEAKAPPGGSAPSTPRTAREIIIDGDDDDDDDGRGKQGLELPPKPPVPASELNLSREPFDPKTASELPVPSRFVSAAMALVTSMPIERKAKLLVECTRTRMVKMAVLVEPPRAVQTASEGLELPSALADLAAFDHPGGPTSPRRRTVRRGCCAWRCWARRRQRCNGTVTHSPSYWRHGRPPRAPQTASESVGLLSALGSHARPS